MKPGIYHDLSNNDYHKSDGISRSGLMLFRKTPRHYWESYVNPLRKSREATPAMILGTAVHTACLEPQKFLNEFAIKKKVDGRTTDGKEYNKAFHAVNIGKIVLDEEQFEMLNKIDLAIMKDHKQLIEGAKIEHSIFWNDKSTDVLCKVRPDVWHENLIVDLKTTADASPRAFSHDVYSRGYHIQMAMIQDAIYNTTGKLIKDFVFLCVETIEPYLSVPYILDDDAIEKGRAEYLAHLKTYKECLEKNDWPAYESQIISLPNFTNYL